MILLASSLFLVVLPIALGEKIHEKMTTRQLREIFHDSHYDSIPHYDILQFNVSQLTSRYGVPAKMIATNYGDRDVSVWLNPAVSVLATKNTEVLEMFTNASNHTAFRKIPDAMKNFGELWEDPVRKASLIIKRDTRGQLLMDGHIGSENLIVRSLPESLALHLKQNTSRDAETAEKSEYEKSAHHIVFERKKRSSNESGTQESLIEKLQNIPEDNVLFIELMIIVDYDLFLKQKEDINKTLAYVLAYWNGVDILYRKLAQPAIRFHIKRIIIAKDETAVPYMYKWRLPNGNILDFEAFIGALTFWYETLNEIPFESYDVAVTMTGRQMEDMNGTSILGLSLPGAICENNDNLKAVASQVIVSDNGNFQTIVSAAHEFAHLMNVPHDNDNESLECSIDQYIMYDTQNASSPKAHEFSNCSLRSFTEFFKTGNYSCLNNHPNETDPLPRILPAQLIDRNSLCAKFGQGESCYDNEDVHNPCIGLYCHPIDDPSECYQYHGITIPDGTYCGTNKMCLNGVCRSSPN